MTAKHDRDSIFSALRDQILRGELAAGTLLREVALGERFGVSRTPVRDALIRLEEAGLILRTGRGLEVRGVDPQAVVQVYDMRILLEEEVAGQAAENRSINDLLKLEALLERDQRIEDRSDGTLIQANLEFHRAVWDAAANPILIDLLQRLDGHLVHAPRSTLSVDGRWEESLTEHAALVDALRSRDREQARVIARRHFEQARTLRLSLLRQLVASESVRDL
ncbi:GntR family transcriptional regulator [Micrococcus terreus]|uniref:GntR family transcriptional regulator n=1 Tax=Micrococcus terreus TaxID=574650 RepID=UPI00254E429D|nr:GntR family transcriptional regulator [Micrococcus terreus]MDK7702381.1 GntR family transcriptional regulator [Micrococcus terreus]WOO96747.1 GntR family transcriptional regulator [Micrococcus terreus]